MKRIMQEKDPEARQELDRLLADLSGEYVGKRAVSLFGNLPTVIQQAQQLLAALGPQGMPQMPVDPNKMAAIEQKREADAQKAQLAREKLQSDQQAKVIDIQDRREGRKEKLEFDFTKLSAEERGAALELAREDVRQAQEIAARLEELAMTERAEDERTGARLESEERRNTQDNLTALKITSAEIESGEKVDRSTGTGANPNPSGSRSR
jgi:hypothetical protein